MDQANKESLNPNFNLPQAWDQDFIIYDHSEGIFRKNFLIRARDGQPMSWNGTLDQDTQTPHIYQTYVTPMASQGLTLLPQILKTWEGHPIYLGTILTRASDGRKFVVVRSLFTFYLVHIDQKEVVYLEMSVITKGKLILYKATGHLFDSDHLHHYQPKKWPGIA